MATRKQLKTLTVSQIGEIRHTAARKASQILARLNNQALGELKNPKGEPIEMTRAQIDAAKLVLAHVLPSQAAVQLTTNEPERTPQDLAVEIQAMREQLIRELTPDEISQVIGTAH